MDYKYKYLKYKNKYLQLKNNLQYGGVKVNDNIDNMRNARLGNVIRIENGRVYYEHLLNKQLNGSVLLADENITWKVVVLPPRAPPQVAAPPQAAAPPPPQAAAPPPQQAAAPPPQQAAAPPYSPQQNAPQLSPRLQQVRDAVMASIAAAPKAAPPPPIAYEDEHQDNPFLVGNIGRQVNIIRFPFNQESTITHDNGNTYSIRHTNGNSTIIQKNQEGINWRFA